MSQPPDDDFYSSSTEITALSPQGDFPRQGPSSQPDVEQLDFPPQNPLNQPGMEQLDFPPQGPSSHAGFEPGQRRLPPQEQPGPSVRSISQPGFAQPGYGRSMDQRSPGPQDVAPLRSSEQGKIEQQRPPSFPPPSGPISQPGFSSVEQSQRGRYPVQLPAQPGNNPQSGEGIAPWEQQPGQPARQPQQPAAPPWQQSNGVSSQQPAWQQPNVLADWPTVTRTQTATKPQRSMLMLIVALVALVLLIIGSGTFLLFSQKGQNTSATPVARSTSTAHKTTPLATHPASTGGLNSINTAVQAGNDWIVTITSAKTTTSSLIAPNAGNTYLELHLTLKNTSGKTLTIISILEFTLTDASGHRYNETATDTNIRRPPDGNINAQQTLNAQLAYEVPTAQHTFILTFAYGLSSNSSGSVAWKCTV